MRTIDAWSDYLDRMFLGKSLYPTIREEIKERFSNMRAYQLEYYKRSAKENKMMFSDYLIVTCTKQIANTEIARKIHRDKIIKPYPKSAEYIRILIK